MKMELFTTPMATSGPPTRRIIVASFVVAAAGEARDKQTHSGTIGHRQGAYGSRKKSERIITVTRLVSASAGEPKEEEVQKVELARTGRRLSSPMSRPSQMAQTDLEPIQFRKISNA